MEGLSNEENRRMRAEKFGINLEEKQQQDFKTNSNKFNKGRQNNNDTRMIDDKAQGMTIEEIESEILRLQSRQQKFGGESTEEAQKRIERLQKKLEFAKHKEAPQQIENDAQILNDSLYFYGVDYMSTDDIKSYFGDRFGEQGVQVTWLNDSSCKIKFESDEQAARAYHLCALSSEGALQQQQSKFQIGEYLIELDAEGIDARNFNANVGWREAFGYQLKTSGRLQKLWMRYATDKDVKTENTKGENSRYYNLQKQKRDQKMKAYGYHRKRAQGPSRDGDNNSNFIKKAISKGEKFQGNLREKLRANEGDDWITGMDQNEKRSDNGDGQQQQNQDNDNIGQQDVQQNLD